MLCGLGIHSSMPICCDVMNCEVSAQHGGVGLIRLRWQRGRSRWRDGGGLCACTGEEEERGEAHVSGRHFKRKRDKVSTLCKTLLPGTFESDKPVSLFKVTWVACDG